MITRLMRGIRQHEEEEAAKKAKCSQGCECHPTGETADCSSSSQPPPARRPRKSVCCHPDCQVDIQVDIEDTVFEPRYWRDHLANIEQMRSITEAPVDTMGCSMPMKMMELPVEARRFQTLVSLMLSSQTRDETTFAAMERLRDAGMGTVDGMSSHTAEEISAVITPVSFHKTKSVNLLSMATACRTAHSGDIPRTLDALCSLKGVGPKMAHLTMLAAWGECTGIAVDVHVHRICNRLGWTNKPTKDPLQTEREIEAFLPKDVWPTVNLAMVGFGQTTCTAQRPKCGTCLNQQICPYALLNS